MKGKREIDSLSALLAAALQAWRHSAVSMRPSLLMSQRAKLRSAWAMNSASVTTPSLSVSRSWK